MLQEMGVVEALKINPKMMQWDGSIGEGVELTVNSKVALGDAYIGCSIAVNGVCLTAISFDDKKVGSIA
jgi:riboflavin synthase